MTELPSQFKNLDSLLNRMTIRQPDGKPGLLASGQFSDAIHSELKVDGSEMKAVKDLVEDPKGRNVSRARPC